jgi:hypothetical protein
MTMAHHVRVEGYAIVSADGMLADRNGQMPDGLKMDADVRDATGWQRVDQYRTGGRLDRH